jgi:hypothetical protein
VSVEKDERSSAGHERLHTSKFFTRSGTCTARRPQATRPFSDAPHACTLDWKCNHLPIHLVTYAKGLQVDVPEAPGCTHCHPGPAGTAPSPASPRFTYRRQRQYISFSKGEKPLGTDKERKDSLVEMCVNVRRSGINGGPHVRDRSLCVFPANFSATSTLFAGARTHNSFSLRGSPRG